MASLNGPVTEICYITASIEESVAKWARILGAGPFYEMPTPTDNLLLRGEIVRDRFRAVLGFSGSTVIEFIQPMSDGPSIFTEVLREKGEGAVHHIYPDIGALTAAEYDALCASYEAKGFEKVLSFTAPGIGRNCFFDARDDLGCYIEVLELSAPALALNDRMYAAHLEGPGDRPLRPFTELLD
jgi:hypothetical protein